MTQDTSTANQLWPSFCSYLALPWVGPIIMIFGIFVGIFTIYMMWRLTQRQILEFRKAEDYKRFISIESLIYELKQNKTWVDQFIHDCAAGSHKGRMDKDVFMYSWVWNPPQLVAYQNYLNIACDKNKELAKKIINLYSALISCQIIVHFIHELFIHNAEDKIAKYNESLEKICLSIKDYFDEPTRELMRIAARLNSNSENLQSLMYVDDMPSSGTSTYDPTYSGTNLPCTPFKNKIDNTDIKIAPKPSAEQDNGSKK